MRYKEFDIFKFSKDGILLTIGSSFNKRTINISKNILVDKENTLDFLYSLLDSDELITQQKNDIKKVIKEFI